MNEIQNSALRDALPTPEKPEIVQATDNLNAKIHHLEASITSLQVRLLPILSGNSDDSLGSGEKANLPCCPLADEINQQARAIETLVRTIDGLLAFLQI